MLKNLGRVIILLIVIGLVTTALVTIVNNSSGSEEFPSGGRPGGFSAGNRPAEFQPDQSAGANQPPLNRPNFQDSGREENGGGAFMAVELLKNLVIITGIITVIVLFRKAVVKLKPVNRVMNDI